MEHFLLRRGARIPCALRGRGARAHPNQELTLRVHCAPGVGHFNGAQLYDVARRTRRLPEPASAACRVHPVHQRPRLPHRAHHRAQLRAHRGREIRIQRARRLPDHQTLHRNVRDRPEKRKRPRLRHRGGKAGLPQVGRQGAHLPPHQLPPRVPAEHDPRTHPVPHQRNRRRPAPPRRP